MATLDNCVEILLEHCRANQDLHELQRLVAPLLLGEPNQESRNARAVLVNLEGLDGVGKSTCVQNVCDRLTQRGVVASRLQTPLPEMAVFRAKLDDAPQLVRRAYYQACNLHCGRVIRRNAAGAQVIVLDRWWPSTFAYALAEQAAAPVPAHGSTPWPAALPRPDLCLMLVLSEAERTRRLASRDDAETREEQQLAASTSFRQRVTECYRAIDVLGEVDASEAPERIADSIVAQIDAVLRQQPALQQE